MKGALYFGSVKGIKLYIHWTFSLLVLWVIGTHFYDGGEMASLGNRLFFLFAVFACVLLHELGHALSALRYGVPTRDITLLPIGGVARLERIPEKPAQELVVAAAGPAVNVLIAIIIFLVITISNGIPDSFSPDTISETDISMNLLIVNISLVIFNLIPAFPMDGGRMLRAVLSLKLNRAKATKIAAIIGQIIAVGFIILGIYANPILAFIGVYIIMSARQEAAQVSRAEFLKNLVVKDVMLTEFKMIPANTLLKEVVPIVLSVEQNDFLVVQENGLITGVMTRNSLLSGLNDFGPEISVMQIAHPIMEGIKTDSTLSAVYSQMLEHSIIAAPVYQNGAITGMITLSNIRDYYMMKQSNA